jgi:DNA-binding NarL/FixJ family response regulator
MRILIVDDSPVVRERLAALLAELEGVEVVGQAQDVVGAVAAIRALRPDVVTLDIRMPGGNGIEALAEVKKVQPAPIVIMLTNYPYPQYRKKCLDAGADYFLDKSTEFEQVAQILKSHQPAAVLQTGQSERGGRL